MSNTLKFGGGLWATKEGSTLAYNDENGNFKPLPFNFTRDTIATRVNKQGLIEVVSNNEPRVDFLNDSKGALLLEPSRTNLITYSEDFSGWVAGYLYITPNYAISPDGTQNASRCLFTGSNQLISTPTSATGTLTGSIYIKGVSGETIQLAAGGGEDLITLNGDWQRLIVTKENINGTFNINTFGGATARDLLIWGAQLEEGSYATSYIPTQGSIGTRVAETCSQTPPSGIIGQTEGTLFIEYPNIDDTFAFIGLTEGSNSNRMIIYSLGDNILKAQFRQLGNIKLNSSSSVITGKVKCALSFSSTESIFYVNGTQIGVGTSSAWSSLNEITLNQANQIGAKVSEIKYYNTRLSNSELAALTQV